MVEQLKRVYREVAFAKYVEVSRSPSRVAPAQRACRHLKSVPTPPELDVSSSLLDELSLTCTTSNTCSDGEREEEEGKEEEEEGCAQ